MQILVSFPELILAVCKVIKILSSQYHEVKLRRRQVCLVIFSKSACHESQSLLLM
jgi:hypothetical protein